MPYVVTGISQDGNTSALESALTSAGLSLDAFEVIEPEAGVPQVAAGGGVATRIMNAGGLETGTGVPGLTGRGAAGISEGSFELLGGNSLWDRLADLAIPDDEVENYSEALENGRSIVAYHGSAKNVPQVEALFAAGGLVKVKTF